MNPIHQPNRRSASLVEEPIPPQLLDPPSQPISPITESDGLLVQGKDYIQPTHQRTSSKFLLFTSAIIQNILWTVNANSFASLCILNRQWYHESQQVELYAHHLSRCPSYALSNSLVTGPFKRNDLQRLKTRFAKEVRRNLFDAFARPRKTVINLISLNASSSAAFPGGEAFRFEFSPNGQTILALSSSRIYILDATADPVVVTRELKTVRRPLSASITDDGSLLAVLSSKYQANIYGLTPAGIRHFQVIVLETPPRTIAIAHEGTVLAAAYETGVEVFSLAANSLTTDRRAVRSEAVDTLTFSGDGSMLVGSSLSLDDPNAVVISAPFYTENDPDLSSREIHSRMWTTQILFPQISSVCSHVALLPGHTEGDACWLFAFDHSLMSYRAVRTDDTRAGVVYFLSPPSLRRFSWPTPTIAPTASACGTIAVAGFSGSGLWLYGIPERLDVSPDMGAVIERHERSRQMEFSLTSATGNPEPLMAYSPGVTTIGADSDMIEDDSIAGKVDWRQSIFVKCVSIDTLAGHTTAKWIEQPESGVSGFSGKRLVVVAPGGVGSFVEDLGEESMPVDGSRLCVLDFDYAPSHQGDCEVTIEVGDREPELLTEHTGSLANEVAMERKRTIRAIPASEPSRMILGRSVTAISPPVSSFGGEGFRRSSVSQPSSPVEEPASPFGGPSRPSGSVAGSMQRSATAAGFRFARYPPRPPLGSQPYSSPGPAGSRAGEHVRTRSEDSWETPPPPYTGASASPPVGVHHTQTVPTSPLPPNTSFMQATRSAPNMVPYDRPNFHHPQAIPAPQPAPATDFMQATRSAPNMVPYDRQTVHVPIPQQNHRAHQTFTAPINPARPNNAPTNTTNNEAGPQRRVVSQYGTLARHSHTLDPVSESPAHRPGSQSMQLPPSNIGPQTRMAAPSSFGPRPTAHDGNLPEDARSFSRAQSAQGHYPTAEQLHVNADGTPRAGSPSTGKRISLTGANLQNRLNHPMPPIPNEPHMPGTIVQPVVRGSQQRQAEHPYAAPESVRPPPPRPIEATGQNLYPSMPTPNQLSNLHRRFSHTEQGPSTDFAPPNRHTVYTPPSTGEVPATAAAPPRGAWGAAGVPGLPSFHQARNVANGLSRSSSRNSQQINMASASAPNLLLHAQRPKYGRLDTINSVTEPVGRDDGGFLGRTQSLFQGSATARMEESAYNETRAAVPNSARREKKPKKKRDGGEADTKKGTRCSVM